VRLTGDAAATDPVCRFSPHHGAVLAARDTEPTADLLYRTMARTVRDRRFPPQSDRVSGPS
jgi:pyrroloquinoline quinone biosynthesis protein E